MTSDRPTVVKCRDTVSKLLVILHVDMSSVAETTLEQAMTLFHVVNTELPIKKVVAYTATVKLFTVVIRYCATRV